MSDDQQSSLIRHGSTPTRRIMRRRNPDSHAGERVDRDRTSCQNCGEPLRDGFRRVFGDDENLAHACYQCASQGQIRGGAAARPDYDLTQSAASQGKLNATALGGEL